MERTSEQERGSCLFAACRLRKTVLYVACRGHCTLTFSSSFFCISHCHHHQQPSKQASKQPSNQARFVALSFLLPLSLSLLCLAPSKSNRGCVVKEVSVAARGLLVEALLDPQPQSFFTTLLAFFTFAGPCTSLLLLFLSIEFPFCPVAAATA